MYKNKNFFLTFSKKVAIILSVMIVMTMVSPFVIFADETNPTEPVDPVVTEAPADPEASGTPTAAPSPEATMSTEPSVTVIGSTIKNSKDFFELSLEVNPGLAGFSTTGIVLGYNSNIIVPVSWDEAGTTVTMGETSDWQHVAAIPAVAPTTISGKVALAYKPNAGGAEPTATPGGDVPTSTPAPTEEPSPTPTADSGVGIDETEEGEATAAPEPTATPEATMVPTPKDPAYLYISSETSLPVDKFAEGQTLRTITVRFKYVGETDEEKAKHKQEIINGFESQDIVWLAPDDVAAESPAGQVWVYSTGDTDASELEDNGNSGGANRAAKETHYYYTYDKDKTAGLKIGKLLSAPQFKLFENADTANSGGSDPSKFAALVFFDWDEKTLLGSVVVDGSASTEEINEQINAFNTTLLPPGFTLPTASDVDAAAGETLEGKLEAVTEYNPDYPLTSHKGYTFGKWVDFDSDAFTVYGRGVDTANGNLIVDIPTPVDPDFTSISGGKVLKAAYISNALLKQLESNPSLCDYTISNDDNPSDGIYDPNEGYFGRFGVSDNYAVRAKVTRVNNGGSPVHRPRQTAIRAVFSTSGGEIFSLVNLENVDEQIVEVAAPVNATSVSLTVVDIGGYSNWVGTATRSAAFPVENADFVLQGNIMYMNEYPDTVDHTSATFLAPAVPYFTAAGLSLPVPSNAGRRNAIRNIAAEQVKKLAATGKKYLTQAELQAAITYGDYTKAGQ